MPRIVAQRRQIATRDGPMINMKSQAAMVLRFAQTALDGATGLPWQTTSSSAQQARKIARQSGLKPRKTAFSVTASRAFCRRRISVKVGGFHSSRFHS
jgi:hypothetical protein